MWHDSVLSFIHPSVVIKMNNQGIIQFLCGFLIIVGNTRIEVSMARVESDLGDVLGVSMIKSQRSSPVFVITLLVKGSKING